MRHYRGVADTFPGGRDRRSGRSAQTSLSHLPVWKLEDAKARFSQLVRLARTQGPQRVTCRGEDVVVVLAAEEFARLAGAEPKQLSLGEFLRGSGFGEIDVTREEDRGREIAL
jgi:prevent-host-death family protein